MKKCPYCAEKIQDEAIVCRYCGRDLPNLAAKDNTEKSTKSQLSSPWRQGDKVARIITILGAIGTVIRSWNNPIELAGNLILGSAGIYLFAYFIVGGSIWLWRRLGANIFIGLLAALVLLITAIFYRNVGNAVGLLFATPTIAPTATPIITPTTTPIITPTTTPIITPTTTPIVLATPANWATQVAYGTPIEDISNCIHWQDINASYVGKLICTRGVIMEIYRPSSGNYLSDYSSRPLIYFSDKLYILTNQQFIYGKVGDCIIVFGKVSINNDVFVIYPGDNNGSIRQVLCY